MNPEAQILGDWGTSNLRLWLYREGKVASRIEAPGVGALSGDAPRQLADLTAAWRSTFDVRSIVLCGMAGARSGLHEAGYVDCPATTEDWACGAALAKFADIPLQVAAGLASRDDDSRDDVMRGEETQVFGALRLDPTLAEGRCTIVLPGTHSKWVTLDQGRVTALRTFLTGELHALLCHSSLLAAGGGDMPAADDADGFAEGLVEGRGDCGLTGSLFHARAAQLRQGRTPDWARSYLSGLLLASEVAQMERRSAMPEHVVLIGAPALCARYSNVLASFAVSSRTLDDEACTLAGLELILAYN